jgi:hypothetical protein
VSIRPKDANGLGDRGFERRDNLDDVSATDEVERAVAIRDVLHHPFQDPNSTVQVRFGNGVSGSFHEAAERLDADSARARRAHQLDPVRGIAASHVENDRLRCEALGRQRQHRVRAAW